MVRFRLSTPRQRAALLIVGIAVANLAGAAGLSEVKQTVFGMDCAPCAHGVEQGLSELDGVQGASVSLNDGYALVELSRDSSVTLEQIRRVIEENGFTPKDATVVASGTVTLAGDELLLASADGQTYRLLPAPETLSAWDELQTIAQGSTVEVKARVSEDDAGRLYVLEVRPPQRIS